LEIEQVNQVDILSFILIVAPRIRDNFNMKYSFTVCVVLSLCSCLSACGGSSSGSGTVLPPVVPPVEYQQPDPSICDFSLNRAEGLLCAIQPSRLDPTSRDIYGSNTYQDRSLGFGYHAIAFPETGADIQGVYIHLTGSYGRAFNQTNDTFSSADFLDEALSAGYITVQVAYNNRFAVNLDECGGNILNLNTDNCAGDVRWEKITGEDMSAVTETPIADSIEYRLIKIFEYLESNGVQMPENYVTNNRVEWRKLRTGGHSQGATHALYLVKYFSAARACMLAGGYDVADTVPSLPQENIADWFLDNSQTLDIGKIFALVSIDDSSYDAFIRGYNVLGLVEGQHFVVFSGAPYSDSNGNIISGHAAALKDPRYINLRNDACFAR